jgi:hypothetical protein
MRRRHAAVPAIVSALLIFPSAAMADGSGKHRCKHHGGLGVQVLTDNRGHGSTDVDVTKSTVGPNDLPAVQVTATPGENRPLGPLAINVNAQVAVVQVALRTDDPSVLDNINVGITQGNGPAAGGAPPANGGAPPANGGAPPPNGGVPPGGTGAPPGIAPGVSINVNAQVAIVQVVVGTGTTAVLKNINVTINQGNQVAAPPV